MQIEWREEYSLGLEKIDQQHRQFVAALNSLYWAVEKSNALLEVDIALGELKRYTQEHFATEEEYFEKTNYPEKFEHMAAHQEFREKIKQFEQLIENGETSSVFSLIGLLEGWLLEHLIERDHKYVNHFKTHGIGA